MSGLQQKLDNMRDSIASLFKRRQGRSKNGRISTPQNVKRVMHITFDSANQSFEGIPNQWRGYFEGQSTESATVREADNPEPVIAEATETEHAMVEPPATEHATVEPPATEHATVEPPATEHATVEPPATEHATVEPPATNHTKPSVSAMLAPKVEGHEESVAVERKSVARAPRELLSLVYDRDNGQFVNLPPHWDERLRRNNLLEPEFQTDPKMLALVFSLMDQELRAMRAEGERVESCLYSSLPRRKPTTAAAAAQDQGRPLQYVFRIEADKSNSSSDWDLAESSSLMSASSDPSVEQLDGGLRPRGSFVTVKAVEVPEDLDTFL